jgi:small-conductance mechanosensitive channel
MVRRQVGSCIVAAVFLLISAASWLPGYVDAAAVSPANPVLRQQSAAAASEAAGETPAKPDEQAAQAAVPAGQEIVHRSLFASLLHGLIGQSDESRQRIGHIVDNLPNLLPELRAVFLRFCPDHTGRGALRNIFWVMFFIGCGLAAGSASTWMLRRNSLGGQEGGMVRPEAGMVKGITGRLGAGLISALPPLLGLVVFFLVSYSLYYTLFWVDTPPLQLLFIALLLAIALIRSGAIILGIIFAPASEQMRLLPLSSEMAAAIQRLVAWSWGYIVIVFMLAVAIEHLGAKPEIVAMVKVLGGTLLLGLTAVAVVLYRGRIRSYILAESVRDRGEASWVAIRLASLWHLLTLLYLFLLWVMMLATMINNEQPSRGAFVMSFFILPIWLMADRLIQWLVRYALQTLKLDGGAAVAHAGGMDDDGQGTTRRIAARVMPAARTGVVMVLGFWLASLWGYDLPFMSKLVGAAVDSLVIVALALIFWRALSSWIEAKIVESMPEKSGEDDTHDDEWGPHTVQDRSLTLLPIVRKFVGIILVVMVAMTVLSSLGVDIGPLLAGAGVLGLAVGFGAQKIVSDIFSGFFYLLDDAFRVGEYVNAGSISGTVEKITLRNLMLRHHRGMLQIVPHSDLGPITNFMRGGIIEKFSLDFPYDTDIDKIRKIIKKVGQEMLEDPELGPNFLRPMKSQGVREITNSVMTIRVKFTARPGTHFLIRREAFKRITQALKAKGINYAHRKVIVDLPAVEAGEDAGQQARLAQAAGAAAQRIIEQEEEQLKAEQALKAGKA